MEVYNIPEKFINKLIKNKGITLKRGSSILDKINALEKAGMADVLIYLDEQFKYAADISGLTIIKPQSDFPKKSISSDAFLKSLVMEKYINEDQIGSQWEPKLEPRIQICGIDQDGSDVSIKMVEEKGVRRKIGYGSKVDYYASFAKAVVHFSDQVIELRCSHSNHEKFAEFVMRVLGYPQPYRWQSLTKISKEEAKEIKQRLAAGVASTQIEIPTSVGSIRFNSNSKNVNLDNDPVYTKMTSTLSSTLGVPTDDKMDEICYFEFTDPISSIEIPVSFVINLKKGYIKFNSIVTQMILEQVLDAFIQVVYLAKLAQNQTATGQQ